MSSMNWTFPLPNIFFPLPYAIFPSSFSTLSSILMFLNGFIGQRFICPPPPNDWISQQHIVSLAVFLHLLFHIHMADYLIYYYFPGECQGHSGLEPV